MIHTSVISAPNNAGNPHITARLLPGKGTEAKRGHTLPAATWRLDLGGWDIQQRGTGPGGEPLVTMQALIVQGGQS